MSQQENIEKTMRTVARAASVMEQFYRNVADLLFLISHRLDGGHYSYKPLLENGALWTSSLDPRLNLSARWQYRHIGFPLQPDDDDDDLPMLLFDVSLDDTYNELPEIWIGLFDKMEECAEIFPYEETLKLIFEAYFAPEEDWTETRTWYEQRLEELEDGIDVNLFFYRLPLELLVDQEAVQKELIDVVLEKIEELLARRDEEDENFES